MDMSNPKIHCPECRKTYTINNCQTDYTGKRIARCVVCDKKFIVEFFKCLEKPDKDSGEVAFLRSYFEKRGGVPRRKVVDRRKVDQIDYAASENLPNDVIPLFNNRGDAIIGHISPGRREKGDRRRGVDRRQYFSGH
jgi:hypothetical protein